MRHQLLIPIFIIGAVVLGYLLGSSEAPRAEPVAPLVPLSGTRETTSAEAHQEILRLHSGLPADAFIHPAQQGWISAQAGKKSTNFAPNTLGEKAKSSYPEAEESTDSLITGAHHVHAITYDNEGNLLLGTHGGLFKSLDGGKTWQKVKVVGSVNADDWMSLVVDPRNGKIVFAGGHDLGVIKSIDGGITWKRSDDGIKGTDIHGLAINQGNPDLLFAYSVDNGVFKSKDGGVSWQRMDDGPENPGVRSFVYLSVQTSMDKSMGWDNWGLLLAGTADGIFQSFSCFCGWTKTTNTIDNTTVYTLATLHKDLTVMYAGTQAGAWKTIDAGQNWKKLDGLNGVKITAIAINPENSQELTASSEDGLIYRSSKAGENWQRVN